MSRIDVLLCEHSAKYRNIATTVFKQSQQSVVLLCEALPNSHHLTKAITTHKPAIVIIDFKKHQTDNANTLIELKSKFPNVKVIIWTNFDDFHRVFIGLCYGVSGYVLKNDDVGVLFNAIQVISRGGFLYSESILNKIGKILEEPLPELLPVYASLNNQELITLKYLSEGKNRQEIAEILNIKISTVGDYTKAIYKELGVHNATQAVMEGYARRLLIREH